MTVLIVLHNSDLSGEIASSLHQDGHQTAICPSVTGPEFLKQFPQAALVITDLSPLVLRVLQVDGKSLLGGDIPFLFLASSGHREPFAAMLTPDSGDCLALEWTPGFLEQLRQATRRLARKPAAHTPSKCVSVDRAHRLRTAHPSRRALSRQDRFVSNIVHDLRTPLTAINEFARIMATGLSGEMTERQRQYVGIIERRCQIGRAHV